MEEAVAVACEAIIDGGGLEVANDVLRHLKKLDDGERIEWMGFHSDPKVRAAFRKLLTELKLRPVEKRILKQSQKSIAMAYEKPRDYEATLGGLVSPILAHVVRAKAAKLVQIIVDEARLEGATDEEKSNAGEAEESTTPPDAALDGLEGLEPPPAEPQIRGGGLMSIEQFQKLDLESIPMEYTQPPEEEEQPVVEADPAALKKHKLMRDAEENRWGLSASKQQRLLSRVQRALDQP